MPKRLRACPFPAAAPRRRRPAGAIEAAAAHRRERRARPSIRSTCVSEDRIRLFPLPLSRNSFQKPRPPPPRFQCFQGPHISSALKSATTWTMFGRRAPGSVSALRVIFCHRKPSHLPHLSDASLAVIRMFQPSGRAGACDVMRPPLTPDGAGRPLIIEGKEALKKAMSNASALF